MLQRPSNHEICKKVRDALEALKADRFMFGPTKHLSGDMDELELESEADLTPLLIELLEEISDAGQIECYAGSPPLNAPTTRKLARWNFGRTVGKANGAAGICI